MKCKRCEFSTAWKDNPTRFFCERMNKWVTEEKTCLKLFALEQGVRWYANGKRMN